VQEGFAALANARADGLRQQIFDEANALATAYVEESLGAIAKALQV
jgi:hypothetical protein